MAYGSAETEVLGDISGHYELHRHQLACGHDRTSMLNIIDSIGGVTSKVLSD
jgi:hypothetical protein